MGVFGHWYILLFVLAFWAVVIVAVVWLVMWAARTFPGQMPSSTAGALSILNERFARGEIDQAEYEARKAALRKKP